MQGVIEGKEKGRKYVRRRAHMKTGSTEKQELVSVVRDVGGEKKLASRRGLRKRRGG